MQHLSPEDLARLADEAGEATEALHLRVCGDCRAELEAIREQGRALRSLPDLRAPGSAWPGLEERLRAEGLISGAPAPRRIRFVPLLRIAAMLAVFVAGGVTGAAVWSTRAGGTEGPALAIGSASDPEAAAEELRVAEAEYLTALARYAELTGSEESIDPVNRLAALEGIVLTARAALREAPADPLINGYLLTALGQREAILRRISRPVEDTWF